ncbi:sensor histidine kinase [Salinispira pacifica]
MRKVRASSTRYAYLFVSVNLVLLVAFFVSMSISIRQVDASRIHYDRLVRDWFSLRLALIEERSGSNPMKQFARFDAELEAMGSSELLKAAEKLYVPLSNAAHIVIGEWTSLRPKLLTAIASPSPTGPNGAAWSTGAFQSSLLAIEGALDEFVGLQQRAIRLLLYFLGGTIVATIAIFFLVESELAGERRAAALVRSFASASLDAQERERERISRALHDSLAQELTLAMFEVGEQPGVDPGARTDEVQARLRSAVDWVRNLAHELHPTEIDQLGLAGAIRAYGHDIAGLRRSVVDVDVPDLTIAVPRDAAMNIYRIAQEAVTNSLRHADAARTLIRLEQRASELSLLVEDDGRGFRQRADGLPSGRRGLGIVSMQERARILGARLSIESRPNHGTRIRLTVPLSTPDAAGEP